jgi:hypothetical protein
VSVSPRRERPVRVSRAKLVVELTAAEAVALWDAAIRGETEARAVVSGDPDATPQAKTAQNAALTRALDKLARVAL